MMRRGNLGLSVKAKVHRLVSEIDRVRERSKGDEADWKAAINIAEAAEGRKREREKVERIKNSLGEEEVQSDGIIANLQGLRRANNDSDQRIIG